MHRPQAVGAQGHRVEQLPGPHVDGDRRRPDPPVHPWPAPRPAPSPRPARTGPHRPVQGPPGRSRARSPRPSRRHADRARAGGPATSTISIRTEGPSATATRSASTERSARARRAGEAEHPDPSGRTPAAIGGRLGPRRDHLLAGPQHPHGLPVPVGQLAWRWPAPASGACPRTHRRWRTGWRGLPPGWHQLASGSR